MTAALTDRATAAVGREGTVDRGEVAVRLAGVTKRYANLVAVDSLDLDVPRGEFLALLGPSGCGKTTSLRLIGGFESPDAGAVVIEGVDVTRRPPDRRPVNTVFQSYALFPHMSVADNVGYGLRIRGVRADEVTRRVGEMLELVGLGDVGAKRPRQLSGGMQQRVALARALILRPAVLLLDEPLGSLDLKFRKQMQVELRRIHREVGGTFIHVTHDQEEAMTMADRICVMDRGRIVQMGMPTEIYDEPRSHYVAGFIGTMSFLAGRVAAVDGDRAIVTVPAVGDLAGRPASNVRVDDPVVLALRPEHVSVTDGDMGGTGDSRAGGTRATVLQGRLTDLTPTGAASLARFATADAEIVALVSRSFVGRIGKEYALGWDAHDARVFVQEASA